MFGLLIFNLYIKKRLYSIKKALWKNKGNLPHWSMDQQVRLAK
jgi:hypothetical protein